MSQDVYERLAAYLDRLPGGYQRTANGVELRILQHLFNPQQAELAQHLTLIAEEAHVIARRAGLPVEQTHQMLDQMAAQGLVYDIVSRSGRPTRYMASQFVIGIWEYQVQRLHPELIEDVDQFFKQAFDFDTWRETPQLRTIPVAESLPSPAQVLDYERAEELVDRQKRFLVAECICRKERRMVSDDHCDKPLETCLIMGGGADYYQRHGFGKVIGKDEALEILQIANQAGLVLQPGNSQDAAFICACCGDCCGVLRNIRRHPQPGKIVSSAYRAVCDAQICSGCGECLERCQMEAIVLDDGYAVVLDTHCIGCGLCVTSCSTGAMQLQRKPEKEQPYVPKNIVENTLRLARQRGVMDTGDMVMLALKSKVDRLLATRQ